VNKTELIDHLAKQSGLTKVQAGMAVNALMGTGPEHGIIVKALKKGDSVTIPGFGTFGTSKRKAREGRNPQTGATIRIAARTVPTFRAGKSLRDAVAK
jgi:DNA-binding protein HU-beta